jgi:aspartyl-tRNA(Asn)/glutamyl-tRNA(Gln) amidotransferase subunit B
VTKVFKDNPEAVKDAVKDAKAINFLLGKIMQETRGRVDPSIANKLIKKKLSAQ